MMPSIYAEAIRIAAEQGGHPELLVEAFDALPSTSVYLGEQLRDGNRNTEGHSEVDSDAVGNGANRAEGTDGLPRLCAVDLQTAGTGRRGKVWLADRGNIMFSIAATVDRPASELMGLSLVTGVCIAQVLSRLTGIRVGLKWPNDLLIGDAKLGGILIELLPTDTPARTTVITGIGINLHQRQFDHQGGLAGISLEALSNDVPPRGLLIGTIAAHLLDGHRMFAERGWAAFEQAWQGVDHLCDRPVTILHGEQTDHATARGVDENGALLVEQDGQIRPLYSGEVSVRLSG